MSMRPYLTILHPGEDEFVEKRSRFIGRIRPVTTEQQALDFINEMRAKHWDATHNCYAYVLREGQTRRYSDDGEPQGTAGVPMLDVLLGAGLTDVAVVVTRYFGGVLLGTGGLVRAYSKGARVAVDATGIVTMQPCQLGMVTCDYNQYGRISALIPQLGGKVEDAQFGMVVVVNFSIPCEQVGALEKALADATRGEVIPRLTEIRYMPCEKGFDR
ncbi:IMPACT family member YigZ [Eubacteriaceae bacterium CHKCI005]|nr:IMPACT family member YigZ [Eubacteriaceae bacterium CHKCI005]